MDDGRRSRRELFTFWRDLIRETGRRARSGSAMDADAVLRPPGALAPDGAFIEACTSCNACVEACTPDSLVMVDAGDGMQLPAINPSLRPCYLCDGLPCVAACPDGALVDPGGAERVRMGTARVNPRRCVTFSGQECRLCHQACPYPDRAILLIGGRPLVSSSVCTGCGLCEYACPESPKAITVIPERDLVPGLRVPKSEYTPG